MNSLLIAFVVLTISFENEGLSKYAGEETRAIKSLSAADIEELERGGGWGLARAAELNGVPGPSHVLELGEELQLTPAQMEVINRIFIEMRGDAIAQGRRLIGLERVLEISFQERSVTADDLRKQLEHIAKVRADLRYTHLSAHLKVLPLLTDVQVNRYNKLRGYGAAYCDSPPDGHDLSLWKKHNNCE